MLISACFGAKSTLWVCDVVNIEWPFWSFAHGQRKGSGCWRSMTSNKDCSLSPLSQHLLKRRQVNQSIMCSSQSYSYSASVS